MQRFGELLIMREPLARIQIAYVASRNEGSVTCARDYDDPDVLVCLQVPERIGESVKCVGIKRIERAGAIDRQYRRASITKFGEDRIICHFSVL